MQKGFFRNYCGWINLTYDLRFGYSNKCILYDKVIQSLYELIQTTRPQCVLFLYPTYFKINCDSVIVIKTNFENINQIQIEISNNKSIGNDQARENYTFLDILLLTIWYLYMYMSYMMVWVKMI